MNQLNYWRSRGAHDVYARGLGLEIELGGQGRCCHEGGVRTDGPRGDRQRQGPLGNNSHRHCHHQSSYRGCPQQWPSRRRGGQQTSHPPSTPTPTNIHCTTILRQQHRPIHLQILHNLHRPRLYHLLSLRLRLPTCVPLLQHRQPLHNQLHRQPRPSELD